MTILIRRLLAACTAFLLSGALVRANTYTPTIYFGKGLGTLPKSSDLLRPFAVTGFAGLEIPGRGKTFTKIHKRALEEQDIEDSDDQLAVYLVNVTDSTGDDDDGVPINPTNRALAKQALICTDCQFEEAEQAAHAGSPMRMRVRRSVIRTSFPRATVG